MALIILASDDFNRADNADIGSSWDVVTGQVALKISSNKVGATTAGSDSNERYNAIAFPDAQWAEVVLGLWPGTGITTVGVVLRAAAAANTFYFLRAVASVVTYTTTIDKFVAGTYGGVATENATTWAQGDVLRAEAIGSRLVVYRNNVLLLSATDTSIVSGAAGVHVYNAVANQVAADSWQAGAVVIGGGPADDRWRARHSQLLSGDSALGAHRSAWSDDAGILNPGRDALEDSRSRTF